MASSQQYDESKIPDDFGSLFVTNLPEDVEKIIQGFRDICSLDLEEGNIRLLKAKEGNSTRAGVLDFKTKANAQKASKMMRGKELAGEEGKRVRLNWDSRSMERRGIDAAKDGGGGFSFGGSAGNSGGGGGFGGFGASTENSTGGFGFQNGGPRGFANSNADSSDAKASFSHCGRTLKPFRDDNNNVIGYFFEQPTGEAPAVQSGFGGSGDNSRSTRGGGFQGSSGGGFKRDEEKAPSVDAPVQNGFGGSDAVDTAPPARSFGRGERKRGEEAAVTNGDSAVAGAESTEKSGGRGFPRRTASDDNQASTKPTSENLDKDIMPEIHADRYFNRRKTVDAVVTPADAQRVKTETEGEKENAAPPRKQHPRVEAPKEGEGSVRPTFMNRLRRGRSMLEANSDLESFPVVSFIGGQEIRVKFASFTPDHRAGFLLPEEDGSFPTEATFKKVSAALKNFYETKTEMRSVEENKPVAVNDSGEWFRGICLQKESQSRSTVFLVDYGEQFTLDNAKIQPLDKQFGEPVRAFAAAVTGLPSGAISKEQEEALFKLDAFKVAVQKENPLTVAFADKNIANLLKGGESTPAKTSNDCQGSMTKGTILYVDEERGQLFLVSSSRMTELTDIQAAVQEDANKNLPMKLTDVNAVLFEDAYYRGVVMSMSPDKLRHEIDFVDYGNVAKDVPKESIRGLTDKVAAMEPPSVACYLDGIPKADRTHPTLIAQLTAAIGPEVSYEVVKTNDSDNIAFVRIWNGGRLIGEELMAEESKYFMDKDMKFAVQLKKGEVMDVMVGYVMDPEIVYLNTTKFSIDEALTKLQADLQEKGDRLAKITELPPKGAVVVARFSEDKNWYRAIVDDRGTNRSRLVTYLDYGNSEEVALDDMRDITEELFKVPRAVIPVFLNGLAPIGSGYSKEVIEKARDLLLNKDGQLKVTSFDGVFCEGDLILDATKQSAADVMIDEKCAKKKV